MKQKKWVYRLIFGCALAVAFLGGLGAPLVPLLQIQVNTMVLAWTVSIILVAFGVGFGVLPLAGFGEQKLLNRVTARAWWILAEVISALFIAAAVTVILSETLLHRAAIVGSVTVALVITAVLLMLVMMLLAASGATTRPNKETPQ